MNKLMILRRVTFYIALLIPVGVVCLMPLAEAAPPQFHTTMDFRFTQLSSFPGLEPGFIISITPEEYVSFAKYDVRRDYEYFFDYPEYSITFARRIKEDLKLIQVTNDIGAFQGRRLELKQQEMEFDINKRSLVREQRKKAGGLFQITIPIPSRAFESIFGEGGAGLKVTGYRRITFSGRSTWNDQKQTAFHRQSKFPSLDMEQVYRFDITGTIGSKITVQVSQDSRNDLPLANRLILRYRGGEDDVLQTVEAGNTTLNLPSTQFLKYSTMVQGLFGFKVTAQIADLAVTTIVSQEKGTTESVEVNAGTSSASTKVVRDIEYKKRTVFDLGRLPLYRARSDALTEDTVYDFLPGYDSIVSAIIYVDDMPTDQSIRASRPAGVCYIDPDDPNTDDSIYTAIGNFVEVDPTDYYVNPTGFYVLFLRPVIHSNDVLAVYLEVSRERGGSTYIDTIGDITTLQDTLILKLIKPTSHTRVNHHVWEYEWRNVYWLGGSNLDLADLEVEIYKGSPIGGNRVDPDDPNNQDGVKYLQIFGLDQYNESNQRIPDGKIDRNLGLIDPTLGLLYFPDRHPFDSPLAFDSTEDSEPIFLKDSVPEIYVSTNQSTISQSSEYYLAIISRQRGASTISLNSTNIIEGSEVITYGNTRLTKGVDYNIDYNFGSLTLLKDEYTDINSNLSIMFERAPFFSLSKKTLLGTRLLYEPHRDFRIGTTILYKSDKSTNRKPKIGEETSKILVGDVDFNYRFESGLITRLADAIPFVSATSTSNVHIAGEAAQSRPNPNVDGQVYVDDFEGAKDSYSLGIKRTIWRKCSRPVAVEDTLSERARIGWHNPIDAYSVREIWNRDEGGADIANVLRVLFQPVDFRRTKNYADSTIDSIPGTLPPENSWNGFMRNIPDGVVSQLVNAQLLEMRLRGDVGIMHIDLGMISEDIDGDGLIDTEDRDGFHTLEDDEDIGLDGFPNSLEFGYDPENGVYDPAGDDFDPDNIWKINGTEGNADDPDGGYQPDTEDPHPYNGLNRMDSYFSYKVDLSDNRFEVARNDSNWKTIRIPLRGDLALDTIIGQAYWNEIKYARIWFDSASAAYLDPNEPIEVEIASLELISTTWADSFFVADTLRSGPVSFDVAIINTEVDRERYSPPPGVEGYYDPARDIVEKEQSLLLTFENLNSQVVVDDPPGLASDTGLAVRKLFQAANYMGYGKIEAFVHSNVSKDDSVRFFFRVGTDKNAYYEYRTVLDSGPTTWNPENYVMIDFDEITALKDKLLDLRKREDVDSLVIQDGKYLVKISSNGRDPTLTKIKYFAMGVVNLNKSKKASGEVWIDELRLTDVRNNVGMAARISVGGNMSDLLTYNLNYSTQDAYYRGVGVTTRGGATNNLGSGQTRKNYSFSGSVRLEKFFPRSLEMSMPVSVNWSQNVQKPLLRSGTDITIPDELRDIETSVSINKGIRISESFRKKTRNILFTLLLNQLKTSFNYSTSRGHSPSRPSYFSERYNANGNYQMNLPKAPSIRPLKWMGLFKAPFGLPETQLYLTPNRLSMTGTLTGSYSRSLNDIGSNPSSSDRFFRGGMNVGFKVFDNLNGTYAYNTSRDLKDPNLINITINPKKFKLGVEQSYDQSFRVSYAPKIFNFLTHSADYSARYGDQYRVNRDSVFYHSASLSTNGNFSFAFKHKYLFGTNKRRGLGGIRKEEKSKSFFRGFYAITITGVRYITDAIKPVSVKYSRGKNTTYPSLCDKASMKFRFGLTEDPGVEQLKTSTGIVRKSKWTSDSWSGSSGVSLFYGISADLSYTRKTRETFDAYPTKTIDETWPSIKFNLRSIKGLWILGGIMNALSPSSGYTRSTSTKQRTNAAYLSEKREREAFAPLISFSIRPVRAIQTSARYETNTSTSTNFNEGTGEVRTQTRNTSKSISFSSSCNFRKPTGIKIPILGRIKFESTMSISVNVSYQKTRGESANAASNYEFKRTSEKTNLNIRPSASYSFSSTVKGGLSGRWQDSNDLQTRRKSHTRELGIWAEMHF